MAVEWVDVGYTGEVGLGNLATNEREALTEATKSFYNGRPRPKAQLFSLLFFLELLELSAALWHFMQDNQVIADGFTMTQNYIIKDISAEASKLWPVVATSERGGGGQSDQQACDGIQKGDPETRCTT